MSKLSNALFSFSARGSLGKALSFRRKGSQTIAEKMPVPEDAKSRAQLSWRNMYQKAVALWHALSVDEKEDWESKARIRHMTGFAWFMSQCLKPNPGIYLPLQGGQMQGDIDMAKHKLTKLPAPGDDQEPTRKAELDAHIADKEAHHSNIVDLVFIIDGGGSAIAIGEKGHLLVDFACTLNKAMLLADQTGSIKIDIWKETYANFPPTNEDSICSTNEPEISSGIKYRDNSLSGWTKNIGAQQILAFNVDSCTTITRVTLTLEAQKD